MKSSDLWTYKKRKCMDCPVLIPIRGNKRRCDSCSMDHIEELRKQRGSEILKKRYSV